MADIIVFLIRIFLILAPMYFANSCAMILGGKTPIDLNKKFFDKKPLLGKGKTIKGTIGGISIGVMACFVVFAIAPETTKLLTNNYLLYGLFASIGAIAGDAIGSFLKRRMNLKRGAKVHLLDQLDFIAGGMAFGLMVYAPTIWEILFTAIFTIVFHKFANIVAHKAKIKKVPW